MREDLRKAKKANINMKEKEIKQDSKLKDIGKSQSESEEHMRKDVD